jgi:diguanylate cyclase (GGDEF)-like protein
MADGTLVAIAHRNGPKMSRLTECKALVLAPEGIAREGICQALAGLPLAAVDVVSPNAAMRLTQRGDVDVLVAVANAIPPGLLDFLVESTECKPWLDVVFIVDGPAERKALSSMPGGVPPNMLLLEVPSDQDLGSVLANLLEERSRRPESEPGLDLHGRHREMSILTSTVESALKAGNVGEAMRDLASGLSRLFTTPLLAILEVEDGVPRYSVACHETVSEEAISGIEHHLAERYWLIAGGELGVPASRTVSRLPGEGVFSGERFRSLVVPFFTGDELSGCFGVSFPAGRHLSAEQLLFLDYIPTHLSTVFVGLRRVRFLAMHDVLTGAYNRLYLEEHLKNRLAVHQRYGNELSVVMLDLDNFKEINDTFGHPVGDRLLCEFTQLLRKASRDADVVARYGGDEFVVVLDSTSADGAAVFVQRLLRDTLSRTFAEGIDGVDLTVSAGVTTVGKLATPELLTADRLLGQVDTALYAAKAAGRNCAAVWPSMAVLSPAPGTGRSGAVPRSGKKESAAPKPSAAGDVAKAPVRLMVVDDQAEVLLVVCRVLEKAGYVVDRADSGDMCLEKIKAAETPYDLLVTDLTMPGMDGLQLLKRVRHLSPDTAGIVLTGYATIENAVSSFQSGVRAFLRKPVDRMELLGAVDNALQVQRLENENRNYRDHLERMVMAKSSQLRQALAETRQAFDFAVDGFATLVDIRERSAGRHVLRVQAMSVILGRRLGFSSRQLERLARGAVLHDIGKVGVPDHILLKPGKLDAEEWRVMCGHVEIGYDILRKAPWLEEVAETVRSHHERYDGSGYPRGLRGEAICREARVFAVADSYDAMRVDRVYRKALSREAAVNEIVGNVERLYDPRVVAAFEDSIPELEEVLARFKSDEDAAE